ncbi:transketolase [archaeon]|nr:transketolase [archaeon]
MADNEIELGAKSKELRKTILKMVYESGAGHLGGSLSWADIGTVLFFDQMNFENPNRDLFILSKGHSVPTLYALLAMKDEIDPNSLKTLRQLGSPLQGHPVVGTHSEIHASTGALGQGLSMGVGYAFANHAKKDSSRTYVLLGDGECQEGQVWEAAMSASALATKGRIAGLTAIVDYNGAQGDNTLDETMPSMKPLADKWESFGWYVQEVDGHDIGQIKKAYKSSANRLDKPSIVIAHTKKGSGVSFMEAEPLKWHGGSLDSRLYEAALKDLEGKK